MNTATHSVEVTFPQAFASPARSPFPSAPRYGLFLVVSDRQSDREVGMRPLARFYAAYHHYAQKQLNTLVLLPAGTIYRGTAQTLLSCQMYYSTILFASTKAETNGYSCTFFYIPGMHDQGLLKRIV